jgi:HlyD family secretion protein
MAGGAPGGGPMKGMVTRRDDRIWVLENGKPKAIPVKVGISDGQFSEVSGEGLVEGMQILTGVEEATRRAGTTQPLGGGMGPGGGRR